MRILASVILVAGAAAFTTSTSAASGKTLDVATAFVVAQTSASDCGACEDGVDKCTRISVRRVDCSVTEDGSTCSYVVSTRLQLDGRLLFGIRQPCGSKTAIRYSPLYKGAFEIPEDTNLSPHQSTPYGTTVWLGRVPWPKPVTYRGSTATGGEVLLHAMGDRFAIVSYIQFDVPCSPTRSIGENTHLDGLRIPRSGRIDHVENARAPNGSVHSSTYVRGAIDRARGRISGTISFKGSCSLKTPLKFSAKQR